MSTLLAWPFTFWYFKFDTSKKKKKWCNDFGFPVIFIFHVPRTYMICKKSKKRFFLNWTCNKNDSGAKLNLWIFHFQVFFMLAEVAKKKNGTSKRNIGISFIYIFFCRTLTMGRVVFLFVPQVSLPLCNKTNSLNIFFFLLPFFHLNFSTVSIYLCFSILFCCPFNIHR